jgi:hypothetical protein
MALQASTPIIKDGIEYPFYTVNLAISPNVEGTNIGGSVALRLTPYRVLADGTFEFCAEETKAVAYADVFKIITQGDSALGVIASGIMEKIQEFIIAKGF